MKTALVLQGGGATGSWQAGVLEALLQSPSFRSSVISVIGTSIGGLNGALAVQRLNQAATQCEHELVTHEDVWTRQVGYSLFLPCRLRSIIRRSVSTCCLCSGPVFFVSTATVVRNWLCASTVDVDYDMAGRDEPGLHVFQFGQSHGSPADDVVPALMATAAIPWIYGPVWHNGIWLADGGLVANLPADLVRTLNVDAFVLIAPNPPPERAPERAGRPTCISVFREIEDGMVRRLHLLREYASARRTGAVPVFHLHPGHQGYTPPAMLNFSPAAARQSFGWGRELGESLSAWTMAELAPHRV